MILIIILLTCKLHRSYAKIRQCCYKMQDFCEFQKIADANKIDFIKDKRNSKKCLIAADLVRIDIYLTCTPFFLFPRKRNYISCILSERTISTQYSNTILCNRTQF